MLFFGGNTFYSLPWHLKRDQAYFRGIPFCSGIWKQTVPGCAVACPRTFYAWRSDLDARTNRTPSYLDVGIVEPPHMPWVNDTNEKQGYINCNPDALPVFERTAMSRHAKYKYLLHLEGIAYSSRLSQLMLTNSLVLFQRQPFLEWFYRSLRPGVHYVPFWNATIFANNGSLLDVYDIIDDLRRRDEKDPRDLQRMITAANNFAMKFTTATGRARYLREALTAYRALFIDMDPYLEQFVAGLKAQGKWKEAKDSSVDH
ncbi:hypothetical protein HYH03_004729 [Edaphochlamys debaryana]|uniref:Glycosyl transferase CAP10 domain-containing protein n=1 Tax=Edaphochlamys debaryana TaxID=47281 RepID=A0A835Y9A9_9CHLO|nr:hypothetical protein HYH03_004729 [Edaphochlamys debaryana]|eukprot:KAG2497138.1 hypothetical protein HYH03_004729 [Edaphochlamys debaryana]